MTTLLMPLLEKGLEGIFLAIDAIHFLLVIFAPKKPFKSNNYHPSSHMQNSYVMKHNEESPKCDKLM